jgi:hypothetical protein
MTIPLTSSAPNGAGKYIITLMKNWEISIYPQPRKREKMVGVNR